MYTCDMCDTVYLEPDKLRTIQARYSDEEIPNSIWTVVCCTDKCADRVRADAAAVLTDSQFRGEYIGGVGYV